MLRPSARSVGFYSALGTLSLLGGCNRASNITVQAQPQVWVWGSKGPKLGQFKGPRAIVAAKDGFIYVADRASRVSKWTKDGKCVLNWMAPVVRNGRFEGPEGITDLPDGDIAVTNTHANRVLIYTPQGKLKSQFGSYGTKPGQFLLVTGITTDKDGFIYCSDYGGQFDRVSKWTKEGSSSPTGRDMVKGRANFGVPAVWRFPKRAICWSPILAIIVSRFWIKTPALIKANFRCKAVTTDR